MAANEGQIHQCELLEYLGRYLKFFFAGDLRAARWSLMLPSESSHSGEEELLADWLMFCPYCAKDLRSDTGVGFAGRPKMEAILRRRYQYCVIKKRIVPYEQ